MISLSPILVVRRKPAARSNASANDENFMRAGQSAHVEHGGFPEQIPLVRREERIVRFEPGAIPAVSRKIHSAGNLDSPPFGSVRRQGKDQEQ
jgi:hypothetical protein